MDKIRILGIDYAFKMDCNLSRVFGNRGEARFGYPEIIIDSNFTKQQQSATILHEIVEVINMDLELKLDHPTICQIESVLNQVFQDNPELQDYFFQEKAK